MGAHPGGRLRWRGEGVYGFELSALGVNLILGPSLDVIEAPQAGRSGDPGVLSFGGDPFWAGLLGRSFIEGVHQSTGGSIAVTPQHFPGPGGSDPSIERET